MTVSQKVIKETAQMIKEEYGFHHGKLQNATPSTNSHSNICLDMVEYFARQMSSIFKRDNPVFDEKKFFNLCGMDWLS